VRTVHHGTHIEGNELNLTQAEQAMFGNEVMARERDVQEVINYRKVMEYVEKMKDERLKMKDEIDEEFIKTLHKMIVEKILAPERSGVYRATQVVVKNSMTGEVTFDTACCPCCAVSGEELVDFVNNSGAENIHPVLKGGVVHYELVRIHPFVDGNGRVARVLSTFILFQSGMISGGFFHLRSILIMMQRVITAVCRVLRKITEI